jgi:homeobox-leucine zipper protein
LDQIITCARICRTKLKQTEVDCELLKRCCESLSEENRRLQRELQELRALKQLAGPHPHQAPSSSPAAATQGVPVPVPVPPPLYVQMQMQLPMPAATLSLCPSCERLRGGPKAEPDRPQAATHRFFNPFTHSAAC